MNKWVKNISFSLWSKITAIFFLVLLDLSEARILEIDKYAEWVYFFSLLTMLFWIGWCGVNISARVYVSKTKNDADKSSCIKSSLILRLYISIFICVLIALILPRFASCFGYPDKYSNIRWLFFTSSIMVFFNSFAEFFKEIFIGLNKFNYQFIITVVEYVVIFIVSFIGLCLKKNIESIVCGYLIAGIVTLVVGIKLIHKFIIRLDGWTIENKYIKEILKYAIPIALIGIGGVILVDMDTFMIGLLSSKEDVAIYGIAKNICSKAIHINNAFITGIMTTFSVINEENYCSKRKEYNKALKFNLLITAFVTIVLFAFSKLGISILYGVDYIESAKIIKLLVVYYFFFGISTFSSIFLDYRNKAGSRCVWYMTIVIINLILNYLWIPKYGAEGAACATAISLIPYTIYTSLACIKEWKVKSYTDNK